MSRRSIRSSALLAVGAITLLGALAGCSAPGSGPASFSGTWGESGEGKPRLTIEDDGRYSGTDGCNRLSGTGSVSGDTFRFGNMASTMMACENVDDWLSKASTATRSGSSLVVYDKDRKKVGTLDKQ